MIETLKSLIDDTEKRKRAEQDPFIGLRTEIGLCATELERAVSKLSKKTKDNWARYHLDMSGVVSEEISGAGGSVEDESGNLLGITQILDRIAVLVTASCADFTVPGSARVMGAFNTYKGQIMESTKVDTVVPMTQDFLRELELLS
jgi:hypothetical protein